MSTMAEVIAAHATEGETFAGGKWGTECRCLDRIAYDPDTHAEHVADALTEAGYGKLADAQAAELEAVAPYMLAAALRDIADVMRNERATWCLDDAGRYWIGRTLNELTEYADDLTPANE